MGTASGPATTSDGDALDDADAAEVAVVEPAGEGAAVLLGALTGSACSHFGNAPTKPAAHWLHTRPA